MIKLELDKENKYKCVEIERGSVRTRVITVKNDEKISGKVSIENVTKNITHSGMNVKVTGYIVQDGLLTEKRIQFYTISTMILPPGVLSTQCSLPFELKINAPNDSYISNSIEITYYIEVELIKTSIKYSREIYVRTGIKEEVKGNKIKSDIEASGLSVRMRIESDVSEINDCINITLFIS